MKGRTSTSEAASQSSSLISRRWSRTSCLGYGRLPFVFTLSMLLPLVLLKRESPLPLEPARRQMTVLVIL